MRIVVFLKYSTYTNFIHSLPKVKYGEENANFWEPVRIEEDAIHCRGRWKYANLLGNSQSRFQVKEFAKRAVL